MLQAAIWDVDGTLVDTAEMHYRAWCALTREYRLPFTHDDFTATFGWRNPEIIPKLFGITAPNRVKELGDRKEDLYRTELIRGVALLPGVRDLLDALQAVRFRQAIGSSAPRHNLDLILQLTGTADLFSAVVGMEDTARGKPDPEVFLRAAEALSIPPQRCIVFEDAPVGVRAAKAAGMRCIGVTFANHHPIRALHDAGADLVVPTLELVTPQTIAELAATSSV